MKNKLITYLKDHNYKCNFSFWGDLTIDKTQLGEGGNGIVYKANYGKTEIAIKFLTAPEDPEGSKRKRFINEYCNIILAGLKHGARQYHAGTLNIGIADAPIEIAYIFMKKYECSLKTFRDKVSPKDIIDKADSLFEFLLDAVEEIQLKQIIHRDIKPENILVDEDGSFALSDFGIAHFDYATYEKEKEKLTRSGDRLGNRGYSAPEQDEKKALPHITMDIFAIAQTFHYWVNGRPYRGASVVNLQSLSNKYNGIITKCLCPNPNQRFQTIGEMRKALRDGSRLTECEHKHYTVQQFHAIFPFCSPKRGCIEKLTESSQIKKLFDAFKDKKKYGDVLAIIEKGDSEGNIIFNEVSPETIKNIGDKLWLFKDYKYAIKEIWTIADSRCSQNDNDCILVHYIPIDGIEDNREDYFYEGKAITAEESYNGYVEQDNGDSLKIQSGGHLVFTNRSAEGYFLIGTKWSCCNQQENDPLSWAFLAGLEKGDICSDDAILRGAETIAKRHDSDVMFLA